MTWRLPDTYHSAGTRRGTATVKFYEGRDILRQRRRGDCPFGLDGTEYENDLNAEHAQQLRDALTPM
jgi:hypothetical protein